ncbi:MAG: hypothetical protein ABSC76_10080 [Terracidiphilus sp.]|jgi:hypothetical protein
MPRWIPRFLLCIFFYCISIFVVGRLVNVLAYLLTKGGSPELWQLLHQHFFVRSFIVGLLAGIVPFRTWIAATGIINPKHARLLKRLNPDRLKPWVFAYLSPVFVIALLRWIMQWYENSSQYSSVLQTTSSYRISELFNGFFSTDCSGAGESAFFWRDGYGLSCMVHVQSIAIWLIAIGYSLAPAVRKRAIPLFGTDPRICRDEPTTENIQEIAITEKNDIQ